MVSRKGTALVIAGSLLIALGSLISAAVWATLLLTGKGIFAFMSATTIPSDQSSLGQFLQQHAVGLSLLASETEMVGTGGAFFLGLAALGFGLSSLLRARMSVSGGLYRWLASLGLMCVVLIALARAAIALIDQELDIPVSGLVLLFVQMLPLGLGLIGFSGVLWGSFLLNKPGKGAGETEQALERGISGLR